ncbi:hypothetical protein [Lactococcus lactis]
MLESRLLSIDLQITTKDVGDIFSIFLLYRKGIMKKSIISVITITSLLAVTLAALKFRLKPPKKEFFSFEELLKEEEQEGGKKKNKH